jgi:anti-sigma regulatory factor (Ser/Thr protein kinase)
MPVHRNTEVEFRHEVLFYDGADDFLAGTMPVIRAALAGKEAVLVAARRSKLDLLFDALGKDAEGVTFADIADLGRNPSRIIPAWRDFLATQTADGKKVRGIGEPIWAGRSPAEVEECERYERLVEVAFADPPAWRLLCPYDAGALDDDVLDAARHSHPLDARDGSRPRPPARPLAFDPFAGSLHAAPAEARTMTFGLRDLRAVRDFVAGACGRAGLGAAAAADLALAATELATNSVRHGGGSGTLSTWRDCDALFVEVRDAGRISDLLVGRVRPDVTQPGGRGLWLVNQLCDLTQLRSDESGTVARISVSLARSGVRR